MATGKNGAIRRLRIKPDDDRDAIYAKARKAFTAADLQRYTEIEAMFPAEELLVELEGIHREELRKHRKKKA